MNLKEYQKFALSTAIYPTLNTKTGWQYPAFGLAGESGEILNKLKKVIRDGIKLNDTTFQEELHKELGDLLWYFVILCHELHIDPDLVIELNIDKLNKRMKSNTISGSGDNREKVTYI